MALGVGDACSVVFDADCGPGRARSESPSAGHWQLGLSAHGKFASPRTMLPILRLR